jgi:hypothetical protein
VEDFTTRFEAQITFIYKTVKKLLANYQSTSSVLSSLGASYNGWSLCESTLAHAIENTGEAFDKDAAITLVAAQRIETKILDILQTYRGFCSSIDKVLRARHRKHAEFEHNSTLLIEKQALLTKLESSEYESQRLQAVLSQEGVSKVQPANTGIMAKLNAFLDNDPETTRRNTISKTKELIIQLEEARETIRLDLQSSSGKIQADLDRFQRQKIKDLRAVFILFAMIHREYHQRLLETWEDAAKKVNE